MIETAWIHGLAGGLLIGLSAALYLLFNGRIAGMTGIIRNVMAAKADETGVLSTAFLIAALGASVALTAIFGAPQITVTANPVALVASGLIVGVGTYFGSGCTSGHGVIGLSRLSTRSIVATATFMATTAATVFLIRHVFGATL